VNSLKQSIFDWYRQNEKELKKSHASAFINCNKEQIILTYPSGFTWELLRTDFPNRNLIPCYAKNGKGNWVIDHYEQGDEA
jgi:hypothetical protein